MDPSLYKYIGRVQDMALLSQQQELALARRWSEHGDQAARNLLVQSHLRFVLPIARRYYRAGASMSELVAEGNLGLLHAASKFDPERGYRFVTYAKYWVRVHVSECAIRSSATAFGHSRTLRRAQRELARATALVGEGKAAQRLMAERLKLDVEEADALLCLLQQHQVPFESLAAEDSVCAEEADPEQAFVAQNEQRILKDAVREALATLDTRERRIVEQRLLVEPEAIRTLEQLGDEFGVSRERVRQLEARLKLKLAAHFRTLSKAAARPALEVAA